MRELCLRLIKDDEIIGYEWHGHYAYGIVIIHADNVRMDNGWCLEDGGDGYIKHDSFDLGIKDGDEWYFENDVFDNPKRSSNKSSRKYILKYCIKNEYEEDHYGWYLVSIDSAKDTIDLWWAINSEGAKRIGTVYDKEKDNEKA